MASESFLTNYKKQQIENLSLAWVEGFLHWKTLYLCLMETYTKTQQEKPIPLDKLRGLLLSRTSLENAFVDMDEEREKIVRLGLVNGLDFENHLKTTLKKDEFYVRLYE